MAAKPENASRGFEDSSPQISLAECCNEHFPGPHERLLIRKFFCSRQHVPRIMLFVFVGFHLSTNTRSQVHDSLCVAVYDVLDLFSD